MKRWLTDCPGDKHKGAFEFGFNVHLKEARNIISWTFGLLVLKCAIISICQKIMKIVVPYLSTVVGRIH